MIYITAVVPIIIGLLSHIFNNGNANPLERKLMSNFQKIKITFSTTIITSILFTVISRLGAIEYILKKDNLNEVINQFIFSFVVFFSLLILVDIIFHYRNKKFKFLIKHGPFDKWEIVKVTKGKDLLIKKVDESEDEFYKVVKNEINIQIEVTYPEEHREKIRIKKNKRIEKEKKKKEKRIEKEGKKKKID